MVMVLVAYCLVVIGVPEMGRVCGAGVVAVGRCYLFIGGVWAGGSGGVRLRNY